MVTKQPMHKANLDSAELLDAKTIDKYSETILRKQI